MVYRPPDSAQSFDIDNKDKKKLRFSRKSPADFFFFDGNRFFVIECKTFQDSCTFERSKDDPKKIIHFYQIESLLDFSKYKNVVSGFFLDFRKSGKTYFLEINDFKNMSSIISKSSFTEKDMLNYCSPILLDKKKLKVNYKYNIEKFLNDVEMEEKDYGKN